MHGGLEVLDEAEALLTEGGVRIGEALETLRRLIAALRRGWPALPIHVDLAELRGYHYHTGVVFAAYVPGQGQAVAQGGRYDEIGQVFGRARPATGFSVDLATLLRLSSLSQSCPAGIYAPAVGDPSLERQVAMLRDRGERVIRALSGAVEVPQALGCDRALVFQREAWVVVPLAKPSSNCGQNNEANH